MKRFFLYTLLSFFLLLPSAGQASANSNDSIRLSLLTCAPGEEIQNDGILLRGVLNQFLYERGGLGVTEHIVPEKFFDLRRGRLIHVFILGSEQAVDRVG